METLEGVLRLLLGAAVQVSQQRGRFLYPYLPFTSLSPSLLSLPVCPHPPSCPPVTPSIPTLA